ncbi:hypothetical protein FIV34_13110 [Luteibacter pinisoli]|uniref:Hemagglutinin n=1 Tax=Luteibacter pinisoli TaxID=2589080 RepID=A0A4Y5Z6C0_9GAMM|nr:YadA-like family protein [Luteibacter pinisoli]QDE40089.1 hypothetical protein FIV34_13110 [Luteibacter pinisoli]
MAALVFLTGGLAAQDARQTAPAPSPGATVAAEPAPAVVAATVAVPTKKKTSTATDDSTDDDETASTSTSTESTSATSGTSTLATFSSLGATVSTRAAFTSTPFLAAAAPASLSVQPMLIAPGDPRYPLPAEPNRAGLILGTGGLVGSVGGALSPTLTSLLNPNSNYLSSGALNLASVNVTGTFSSLGIGGLNLVNLTPLTTTINGTVLGQNNHLTLLGGVTSDSYITNINRGTDGFASNGLGGILLPGGSPAWSNDCASLLGIPLAHCWAVNPAQDNQVLVGDKATANGSQEVVIGRGASHTLPAEDANTVFPGSGRNDPNNPSGVPTNNYATRKGNSVVVGDSASGTANAQTIVGANATSNQVNSVVLGNGSVGDRAGAAGYVPFGLAAAQNSVGAVSVGGTGAERQITHVAAGSDNYDAVNVLQLKGATAQLSALSLLSVTYDADGNGLPTNSLTLRGAGVGTGSVGLHNLGAGSLAAGSLDAVNGTQLNTTNQAVAAYFGGTTTVSAAGVFTAPTFNAPAISSAGVVTPGTVNNASAAFTTLGTSVTNLNTRIDTLGTTGLAYLKVNSTGAASVATGVDAVALGAGAVASHGNSVALGAGSVTSVGAQTGYTAIGVAAPQTSLGEVAVGTRKITGLAAGSAPADAVNVAQLTGVNNSVTALGRLAVQYDADGSGNRTNHVTLGTVGTGTVGLGNLAAGTVTAGSADAINGAQLSRTNQAVAAYFGGGVVADATGTFTGPTFNTPLIDTAGNVSVGAAVNVAGAFTNVGTSLTSINTRINSLGTTGLPYLKINSTGAASSATGLDAIALGAGASATNANSIALGAGSVTSVGAQAGYTAIGVAGAQTSTGEIAVGTRKITGLAAGSAAGDAVNVAQLTGVSSSVGALGRLAVQYDNDGAGNPLGHVTLGGTGSPAVGLGNVAAGATTAGSLDAINGSQLFTSNASLAAMLGAGASFNGTVFRPPQYLLNAVNVGGSTSPVLATDVGAAFVSVDTSLGNLNARVNALNLGNTFLAVNSAGAPAVAGGAESVALGSGASAPNANSVALGAGSTTAVGARTGYTPYGLAGTRSSVGEVNVGNRTVAGVAAGVAANEAVNVEQLATVNAAVGGTLAAWSGGGAVYNPATGTVTAPTYSLVSVSASGTTPGTDYHSAADAFASLNGSLVNINNRLAAVGVGSAYVAVNSTGAGANAGGAESVAVGGGSVAAGNNSVALGSGASAPAANSVALGNGSVAATGAQVGYAAYGLAAPQTSSGEVNVGNRTLSGVAAGAADNDAVNVQQLRTVSGDVGSLGQIAVRYDDAGNGLPTNSITLTGAGTGRVGIHNMADGSLASASSDAVTGGQLNTAYTALASSLGGGAAFNGTAFVAPTYALSTVDASGTVGAATFTDAGSAAGSNNASILNVNARLSAIAASGTNYVKVNSTGAAASATGADSVAIGPGAVSSFDNSVAIGAGAATTVGAEASYTGYGLAAPQTSAGEVNLGNRKVTGVAAGTLDTDAANIEQLRAVSGDVGSIGRVAVRYDVDGAGNPLNRVSLVGDGLGGPVAMTNVAAGSTAAGSLDAVNGGQVAQANQAVASALGGGAGIDAVGHLVAPSYTLPTVAADGTAGVSTSGDVGTALASLGGSVNNVNTQVSNLYTTGSKYFQANSSGAAATVGAGDAVAIGPGASAIHANSVALGANSTTTVGARANYAAIGLVPTQNSLGEVNIGSRQLTGVAAGSQDADAVNVAQLRGVSQSVGQLGALSVRYDDAGDGTPLNSVTLAGAGGGPVAIHNLATGSISLTSTDAVNGGQIFATRAATAQVLGGGASVDPTTGALNAPTYAITQVAVDGSTSQSNQNTVGAAFTAADNSLSNLNTRVQGIYDTGVKYVRINSTGPQSSAAGADSVALGSSADASANNSVALGANSVAALGSQANYAAYGLATPQNSDGEVNVGNRQVTGVAAGSADHDAVNVSQLRAVDQAVRDTASGAVAYDTDAGGNRLAHVTLGGVGAGTAVGIGNLANGVLSAGSRDAVAGGQLYSAGVSVASLFGGGVVFDPLTATFTAPSFALRTVQADGTVTLPGSYGDAGTAMASLDTSIVNLNQRVSALGAGFISPYMDVDSTAAAAQATGSDSTAMGGAAEATGEGASAIGGSARALAVRALAMGNGSLATTDGAVAIGSNAVADRTGTGTEAFTGLAVPAQGVVSVGSSGNERQITNVAGGTEDTDAVNLRQLRAVSTQVGDLGASAVTYDDPTHRVATLNRNGVSVRMANLAAGAVAQASTDAINGGQMWAWTQDASNSYSNLALYNAVQALQAGGGGTGNNAALAVNNTNNAPAAVAAGNNTLATGVGSSASGTNSTALGNGAQATADNAVAVGSGSVADRANTVSVGATGAERQVTNVAAGTRDTDAANVSQVNAVRASSVQYATLADGSPDYSNLTVGAAGTPATIHNVSAGVATTDAANVGQLNQVADWSRSYTDAKVNAVSREIQQSTNRASAGVASAMAMAGLPQATTPGRNMAAVAGGTFRGESSIAVGISTVTDSGGWIYKASGTANSRGDAGFSVGAGMEW